MSNNTFGQRIGRPARLRIALAAAVSLLLIALGGSPAGASTYSGAGGYGTGSANCDASTERVTAFAHMGMEPRFSSQYLAARFSLWDYRVGEWVKQSPWIQGAAYASDGPLSGYWATSYSFSAYDGRVTRYAVYIEYGWWQGTYWVTRGERLTTYNQWAALGPAWVQGTTCYA